MIIWSASWNSEVGLRSVSCVQNIHFHETYACDGHQGMMGQS